MCPKLVLGHGVYERLFFPGILPSKGQLVSESVEDSPDLLVILRLRSEVGERVNTTGVFVCPMLMAASPHTIRHYVAFRTMSSNVGSLRA